MHLHNINRRPKPSGTSNRGNAARTLLPFFDSRYSLCALKTASRRATLAARVKANQQRASINNLRELVDDAIPKCNSQANGLHSRDIF